MLVDEVVEALSAEQKQVQLELNSAGGFVIGFIIGSTRSMTGPRGLIIGG